MLAIPHGADDTWGEGFDSLEQNRKPVFNRYVALIAQACGASADGHSPSESGWVMNSGNLRSGSWMRSRIRSRADFEARWFLNFSADNTVELRNAAAPHHRIQGGWLKSEEARTRSACLSPADARLRANTIAALPRRFGVEDLVGALGLADRLGEHGGGHYTRFRSRGRSFANTRGRRTVMRISRRHAFQKNNPVPACRS